MFANFVHMTVYNKITCQAHTLTCSRTHTHTDINNNLAHITHTPCCAKLCVRRTRICIHVSTVIQQHPSILEGYVKDIRLLPLQLALPLMFFIALFVLVSWQGVWLMKYLRQDGPSLDLCLADIFCAWLWPNRPIYGYMSASCFSWLCN